jgi:uncharacterized protein YggE
MLLVTVAFVAASTTAFAHDPVPQGIAVSAIGRAEIPPDRAVVAITIQTQENDLLEARDEGDKEIEGILELGEDYGVRPNDFRITRSNVAYGFDEERGRFFYRIKRNAQITLKDVSQFDEFLAAAIKQGGFNIDDIDFETSKQQQLEADARREAMAAAREKAQQLANLAGLQLGKPRRIEEQDVSQVDFSFSVSPSAAPMADRRNAAKGTGIALRKQPAMPSNPPALVFAKTHLTTFALPARAGIESIPTAVPSEAKSRYGFITTTVRVEVEFEVVP